MGKTREFADWGKTYKGLSNMGHQTPAPVTWGKDDAGMGQVVTTWGNLSPKWGDQLGRFVFVG